MLAKRKSDGVFIDVEKVADAMYRDVATSGIDEKNYYSSELDFNLSEPVEEMTVDGWVAKDEADGEKNVFVSLPTLIYDYWASETGCFRLPEQCEGMFKNLDCKTPQEVTITIKPKKK